MIEEAPESHREVTRLLIDWQNGDEAARERLLPIVYDELREIARRHLRRERDGHTLQPTALANEAYLRLVDQKRMPWEGRHHFFGLATQFIRRILVDHARRHKAAKRGAGDRQLALDEALGVPETRDPLLVRLDEALHELEAIDRRQSRIVELRYFGGLSVEETAQLLAISTATVKRDWKVAKAWLFQRVGGD